MPTTSEEPQPSHAAQQPSSKPSAPSFSIVPVEQSLPPLHIVRVCRALIELALELLEQEHEQISTETTDLH